MTPFRIQELIHRFDAGAGARSVRGFAIVAAFVGIAVLYSSLCFRNMESDEAMDAAQLARNLAEGKGFTTGVVRPFSMYLISRHRDDRSPLVAEGHPDLANAPLYPLLASAVLKVTPPQDMLALKRFSVARGDFVISVLNQCLLLLSAGMVFLLARRLFDSAVASVAALAFAGTEVYWRFSVSGLSTNFVMLLVLLLAWFLLRLEVAAREGGTKSAVLCNAVGVGAILGLLCLARYSCLFLLAPVVVFAVAFVARSRGAAACSILLVSGLLLGPWLFRNVTVSGTPFGTAGFAFMEQTAAFPGDHLQRNLEPNLGIPVGEYLGKLIANSREVLTADLPRMADNWVWAFFAAGLVLPFRNPGLRRLRAFTVIAVVCAVPVQALGKTHIWASSPIINSENLMVLLSPLVLIMGVGAFFVLLDSITFDLPQGRFAVIASFTLLISLPLFLALLPPRPRTIAYPPYYPPRLQLLASWLEQREWVMSDIPAAVSWYGTRQSLLATINPGDEFRSVHSIKPVSGVYLTTRTTENRFLAAWMEGDTNNWHGFVVDLLTRGEVPTGFPLRHGPDFFFVEGQLLLMDRPRWTEGR